MMTRANNGRDSVKSVSVQRLVNIAAGVAFCSETLRGATVAIEAGC
jgi:hypothetical protein